MKNKDECLIESLNDFYSFPGRYAIIENILTGNKKANSKKISLRLLDWFCTNYCNVNRIYINEVNIYVKYKDQLDAFSKKHFDPFCRVPKNTCKNVHIRCKRKTKNKWFIDSYLSFDKTNPNQKYIVTSIGQLNFFKWCIEYNILNYIDNNIELLEKCMTEDSNRKKTVKKTGIIKTTRKVTLYFN